MGGFSIADIMLVVGGLVVVAVFAIIILNRKAGKKMAEQQAVVDQNKMTTSVFVIDKRIEKAEKVNLPKAVMEQLPWYVKFRKTCFVKAKVGPQILTMMCQRSVYNDIPVKKTIKIEHAGLYIMSVKSGKIPPPPKKPPTAWTKIRKLIFK